MNIKLATGVKALPIKVHREKSPVRYIRSETILNLKINQDLVNCVVLGIIKEVRKDFGRTGIQEKTYVDVRNRSHYLDSFYNVKKFKLKSGKSFFKKHIVYCANISMLVNEVCYFRKLDLFNSIVRVRIDEGQGSLKIIMNIFDPTALDF